MNLIEVFSNKVKAHPDKIVYYYLADGEDKVLTLTYSELEKKVFFLANRLQEKYEKGSRALILFDTSLDFMVSFWACLFSGIIAVPVNPPIDFRQLQRLFSVIKDSSPSVLITSSEIINKMAFFSGYMKDLPQFDRIAVDTLEYRVQDNYIYPVIDDQADAFIQYTSGSVGVSKGVLINQENLFNNSAMLKDIMDSVKSPTGVEDSFACWLPLYHDMGLMSGAVLPVVMGSFSVVMSPLIFLQKPYRWLKAISKYKCTVAAAPNFAYELCVKRVTDEQVKELDLSNWSIALNGAEAIRAETIDKFVNKFSPSGFKKEYMFPAYGLAESTVFVAAGARLSDPVLLDIDRKSFEDNKIVLSDNKVESISMVGVGHTWLDGEIAIVNPESFEKLNDLEIGEIWVHSKSIAKKYWQNEKESVETFEAKIKGDNSKNYLRTGDLGFTKDNELFIAGRIKDLIIIKGKNYHPYHIEQTAEKSSEFFRPGSSAAFSIDYDNEERLIVLQEVKKDVDKANLDNMISVLKESVLATHGVPVDEVLLLKAGTIHKTSSGKIQRRLCKKKYLSKDLDILK